MSDEITKPNADQALLAFSLVKRSPKVAVVFLYKPTNVFRMISVSRSESLRRLRDFWEILGNFSADDHSFMLSDSVALPTTGFVYDILPEKSFVIGIAVEPQQPTTFGSNLTLATNFSDIISKWDLLSSPLDVLPSAYFRFNSSIWFSSYI